MLSAISFRDIVIGDRLIFDDYKYRVVRVKDITKTERVLGLTTGKMFHNSFPSDYQLEELEFYKNGWIIHER